MNQNEGEVKVYTNDPVKISTALSSPGIASLGILKPKSPA